ncbi:hypothetical protein DOY81_002307 [Sarcophaga bullata]|nr:hypothetical protein DOY81_002307 [Sarcophaga bullata]
MFNTSAATMMSRRKQLNPKPLNKAKTKKKNKNYKEKIEINFKINFQ